VKTRERSEMRGSILTRWPVVHEVRVGPDDLGPDGSPNQVALGRWQAAVWDAYLDRCPTVRQATRDDRSRLVVKPLRLGPCRPMEPGVRALVATAMTELRTSSFEMAFRIRALGSDGGPVADGRYSVTLVEVATGNPLVLPDQIRRELLAVEADASDYC
jgi:acyl-CoA thioesterase FadM